MICQFTLDEWVSRKIYFSNKIMHELTYSHLSNIRQKSTLWWEVFNKIKNFCLATNGCSATNAIRPPPMSHTSNNYYHFFWSVKDIQGDPTGNKWVKLYNYIIFKSQQFLLHSAPDGRVVWWLCLVRWTIRMIETDLFQNLTSWAKGP